MFSKLNKRQKDVLWLVVAILLLASSLRFAKIGWSFSNNGIDEGIMIERAFMVSKGYDLYTELPCDQAPLAFYLGSFLGGDVVELRVLVASLSMLAIAACMWVSQRIKGNEAMLFTGLLLGVDFVFLRESRTFSLDGLSSFFLAFSILAFIIYMKGRNRLALASSALLVGLSTTAKLFGALGLLGMILFLILEARKEPRIRKSMLADILLVVVTASLPMVLFLLALGPSDVVQGMVFDQGERSFEPFLKLSILTYFGLNSAYVLPLVYARRLWKASAEFRFLLCTSFVLLAFMVLQPLVFVHHLAILSPALAVLAGCFLSDVFGTKKRLSDGHILSNCSKKEMKLSNGFLAISIVGMVVSAGLPLYGITMQDRPLQRSWADTIASLTDPDDFVVSGDPLICAYAHRMVPPSLVNVAYRQQPDLTLEIVEQAIVDYNVSIVVICYRLSDWDAELSTFLYDHGFRTVIMNDLPARTHGVLDLFEEGVGDVVALRRSD